MRNTNGVWFRGHVADLGAVCIEIDKSETLGDRARQGIQSIISSDHTAEHARNHRSFSEVDDILGEVGSFKHVQVHVHVLVEQRAYGMPNVKAGLCELASTSGVGRGLSTSISSRTIVGVLILVYASAVHGGRHADCGLDVSPVVDCGVDRRGGSAATLSQRHLQTCACGGPPAAQGSVRAARGLVRPLPDRGPAPVHCRARGAGGGAPVGRP